MKIVENNTIEKNRLTTFFTKHWGSPEMVISSGVYKCDNLDGYMVLKDNNEIIGLITYVIVEDECEIISLDSLIENKGIGTSLLKKVEHHVTNLGLERIKLVTTNDNLHAIAFYQKRGYRLVNVFPNAVEEARKIKPEIPLVTANGIPILDELLLVKEL